MHTSPIADWLTEWSDLWGTGDLGRRIRIEPGRRLRRSLGLCRPASGRIQIHPALFDPEHAELLREVVCHEAAHAVVYLRHGRRVRPHGREWQRLVAEAGYTPTTRMDPQRLPRQLQTKLSPKFVYRHRCAACGATRMAGRHVRNWRCGACREDGLDGRLQVVQMSLVREG